MAVAQLVDEVGLAKELWVYARSEATPERLEEITKRLPPETSGLVLISEPFDGDGLGEFANLNLIPIGGTAS